MADGIDIDIEVHGSDVFLANLGRISKGLQEDSRAIVEIGAEAGAEAMREHVPKRRGLAGGLASRIFALDPVFHPGGTGGGGTWESHAVVEDEDVGTTRTLFELVTEGTGIYGPTGAIIEAKNVFAYDDDGRHWVVKSIKGMKGQSAWIEQGRHAALDAVQRALFVAEQHFEGTDWNPRAGEGPNLF